SGSRGPLRRALARNPTHRAGGGRARVVSAMTHRQNPPEPRPLDIGPESLRAVQAAIDDIRAGKMIILVDDEDRENEGDLCMAADRVTPAAINFMAMHGRGLICLALR